MLVLLSSGALAMSWQGRAARSLDRRFSLGIFTLILPVAYGVALRLTDNLWRPSIVMTIVVVSASMTAASLAALRWLQQDIATRRDDEQAIIASLGRELDAMREARDLAEERVAQRTKFLARLSHELRTPLTTMVGFSQLLELDSREPIHPSHRQKLSYVIKSGALLQRLVDDMSNLSDVDKGDLTVQRAEVGVQAVLDTVFGMMAPVAARHGVTLQEPAARTGCKVWGDEQRLTQILLNLVGNAIKYNRQGGSVWITVQSRYELIVEIVVHDSGHGIEASRMSQLFEPFNRLGRETSDIPGTGLGLAHCKLLAVLMDGHINATSEPDQGTHMTLTLPGVDN
jgi:two-component system, sensor histidine kinase